MRFVILQVLLDPAAMDSPIIVIQEPAQPCSSSTNTITIFILRVSVVRDGVLVLYVGAGTYKAVAVRIRYAVVARCGDDVGVGRLAGGQILGVIS